MKNSNNFKPDLPIIEEQFLPRFVWLEAEDFEQARVTSETKFNQTKEISQWQIYLNTLALRGFQKYLKQRNPTITINQDNQNQAFDNISYLTVDRFSFCLIILDNLVDELVSIPAKVITSSQPAHFYVLLEILEEEQQLNIHGFLRHDKLSQHLQQNLDSSKSYQLPLSLFDEELNNLLLYTRFLSPSAIKLPVVASHNTLRETIEAVGQTALVNLREWWNGVFEGSWQSTESIFNGISNNYAWGYLRSGKESNSFPVSGTKLIDFGILPQNKPIALNVKIKEENEEKGLLVEIRPLQEEYLPSGLKLKVTLNPNTIEPESQEAIAEEIDKGIQIEFSEAPGKQFQVEVSYQNVVVNEEFVL
ncbi:hypothetical protein NIES4073_25950 [Kalymmatonema gypsitolerans NIES-4073]|nr:hypothetical protein NIES4073_25950 [Scytonema sp. NIES-4073]